MDCDDGPKGMLIGLAIATELKSKQIMYLVFEKLIEKISVSTKAVSVLVFNTKQGTVKSLIHSDSGTA